MHEMQPTEEQIREHVEEYGLCNKACPECGNFIWDIAGVTPDEYIGMLIGNCFKHATCFVLICGICGFIKKYSKGVIRNGH